MLIPSYAAGSIIGKGGQTIVQLQKETGATIKLSKSKDFYPGKPLPGLCPGLPSLPPGPWMRASSCPRDCESGGGPPLPLSGGGGCPGQSCSQPLGPGPEQMGVGAGQDNGPAAYS